MWDSGKVSPTQGQILHGDLRENPFRERTRRGEPTWEWEQGSFYLWRCWSRSSQRKEWSAAGELTLEWPWWGKRVTPPRPSAQLYIPVRVGLGEIFKNPYMDSVFCSKGLSQCWRINETWVIGYTPALTGHISTRKRILRAQITPKGHVLERRQCGEAISSRWHPLIQSPISLWVLS